MSRKRGFMRAKDLRKQAARAMQRVTHLDGLLKQSQDALRESKALECPPLVKSVIVTVEQLPERSFRPDYVVSARFSPHAFEYGILANARHGHDAERTAYYVSEQLSRQVREAILQAVTKQLPARRY